MDPFGRGFMLAGLEKSKYIYLIQYDNNQLSISEPIYVKSGNTICYDAVAICSMNNL